MKTQTANLSKQQSTVEGFEYMNLKFPILFDKRTNAYAIFFNNSETKTIGEQLPEERKQNCKLLKTFDSKEECAKYWDALTLDYFGGGMK